MDIIRHHEDGQMIKHLSGNASRSFCRVLYIDATDAESKIILLRLEPFCVMSQLLSKDRFFLLNYVRIKEMF